MRRGEDDNEGDHKGHYADPGIWIAEIFSGDPHLDPSLFSCGALLGGHGSCPPEIDPLLDLPLDVESMAPQLQLDALEAAYGAEVMHGHGLHLISFDRAEEPWQWRLLEATERKVSEEAQRQGDVDFDTIIIRQLRLYDAREAQLAWACEALGWPGDWVLAYLRQSGSGRFDYGPMNREGEAISEDLYPASDPELERELWKRHGLCPESVDPLRELGVLILHRSREEQLAELSRRFRPWARRRAAIEDFLAGEDSDLADELARYLQREIEEKGISSAKAMNGVLRESVRLEALVCWSAQALGLEASSLVTYLTRRVAPKG